MRVVGVVTNRLAVAADRGDVASVDLVLGQQCVDGLGDQLSESVVQYARACQLAGSRLRQGHHLSAQFLRDGMAVVRNQVGGAGPVKCEYSDIDGVQAAAGHDPDVPSRALRGGVCHGSVA